MAARVGARMKCVSDDYLIASGLEYLVMRSGTPTIANRLDRIAIATVDESPPDTERSCARPLPVTVATRRA